VNDAYPRWQQYQGQAAPEPGRPWHHRYDGTHAALALVVAWLLGLVMGQVWMRRQHRG